MTINGTDGADGTVLSLDVVFDLLADPRRRYLLYYLRHRDRPVPVAELRKHLVEREKREGSTDGAARHTEIDLRNEEIPHLVDAGVVEYDRDLDFVRLRANVRPLDEFLHLAEGHESGSP